MKRGFLFVILVSLLFPIVVLAQDSCASENITIKSVELDSLTGNAKEEKEASVNDGVLNMDLSFSSIGDSVKYHILVENKSTEDYYFNEKTFKQKLEHVEYDFSYDDNSPIIKKKTEKRIDVKVTYNDEISDTEYHSSDKLALKLTNKKINIINPVTGSNVLVVIILSLLVISLVTYLLFKKKKTSALILLVVMMLPIGVFALCNAELQVNCNVSIEKKYTGYAYVYNEMGWATVGDTLDNQKKRFWCPIMNSGEAYYCALDEGYESESECNEYREQYYGSDSSCVSRERLYDENLVFYELNKIGYYRPYYLKIYIENGVLDKVWSCFETDKEYCMRAADNGEAYSANKEILRQNQSLFGVCIFDEDVESNVKGSRCYAGSEHLDFISFNDTGTVFVGNSYGAGCDVINDGSIACTD